MTYRELKTEGETYSEDAGLLLRDMMDWTMTDFLLLRDEEVPGSFIEAYHKALIRLERHEPLQYITGKAPFYGRYFQVGPGVLIPRFDTEILVNTVLEKESDRMVSVLDLCTGSGCIALTLASEGMKGWILGTDISEEALVYAGKNKDDLNISNVTFRKSDMFVNVPERFDVLVSNPPYIRPEEKEKLDPEVKCHEPELALFGGADGLKFYRIIALEGKEHLNPQGRMYLEIGFDEGEEVKEILLENGYRNIHIIRDLAGKERVVICSTD